MKILYINAVCGHGSTGRMVVDLLRSAQRAGHQGKIAFGVGSPAGVLPEEVISFESKWDYYHHNALSRLTDHTGLYSAGATRRLVEEIRKFDPDVIHLHQLHGYYVHFEILFDYLRQANKPVIWTLHDCWAFTGHCTHFSDVGCRQWKTGCDGCPQLRRYPKCYFRGDAAGNYRRKRQAFCGLERLTIVTPSQWLGGLVRQSFLGKYPVVTIPNGIDAGVFRPREGALHYQGCKMVLGVANVWSEKKGLLDFYELSRRLGREYRVVLVGLTEAQRRSLPPGILGLGRTADAGELAALYSSAQVLVNPTYEDTFPTVNLEAQACGTPVVTYDTDGSPETVRDGCVVPKGDVAALCRAVQCVQKSTATERVVFDQSQMCGRYLELYAREAAKCGG